MTNPPNIDTEKVQKHLNFMADELERMANIARRGIFSLEDLSTDLLLKSMKAFELAEECGEHNV